MKNTNSILIIVAIVAILLAGGGLIYSLNQPDSSEPGDQAVDIQSNTDDQSADTETPPATSPEGAADGDRVFDGITIPSSVLANIKRDYPDYVIDDADRETRANGQVEYEVDLEHRDSTNDSDYELTYDANWKLIKTEQY